MIKHLLISFLALSITATAQAGIIVSGDIDDTQSLPSSLKQNVGPESDTHIFLYTEQENFYLASNLDVDYLGSTMDSGVITSSIPAVISSGIKVNSFVINFDPLGQDTNSTKGALGNIIFDTEILGIIWSGTRPFYQQTVLAPSNGFLDLSDDIFQLAGTTYATFEEGRGLEPEAVYNGNGTADKISISNSGYQLNLELHSLPNNANQLRVITAVKVPEPTTLLLFGTAAICLLNLRRSN